MTRVQVYRNLRTGTWSVRDKSTRLVVDHPRRVHLSNCKLFVSQKGNARVRRDCRKNVHAWIEGDLADTPTQPLNTPLIVMYNPYHHTQFMVRARLGLAELHKAECILLDVDATNPVIAHLS